jgi:hypothetical protein
MLTEDQDSESTWIRTHHFRKLDPHPHPDPIKVESWIRIRIKVESWIRIRIKVKSRLRIRINSN